MTNTSSGGNIVAKRNIADEVESARKNWEELTFEEKMERLSRVIENQATAINRLSFLVEDLTRHEHRDNGKIFIPQNIGSALYDAPHRAQNPLQRKSYDKYEIEEVGII